MTIAILPNSAGWKEIGPSLTPEVGAVDLLADARARAAGAAAARPAEAIV